MKTAWHERLRALVQDWPDSIGMPNAANRILGSKDKKFDGSTGPGGRISEGAYSL
mgnify:CR=1 FL=1